METEAPACTGTDTEGEAPPIQTALNNTAYGVIKGEPVKVIEESHKKNYIKIYIYEISGQFYYTFRLKVDRIVRQKQANLNDKPHASAEAARCAARDDIKQICSHSSFVKNIFENYTVIRYNQYELF